MKRRGRPARPTYRRYEATAQLLPSARSRAATPRRALRQAQIPALDRPRLMSLALLAAIALAGVWIGFDDAFYVHGVSVTGNARVLAAEIVAGSRLAGQHALWINPGDAEAALLRAVPSLETARVTCALPADCSIEVTERRPFAAWRWGQAEVWIDRTGLVFAARGDAPDAITIDAVDAPIWVPGQRLEPELLTAIAAATAALPDVRAYRYSTGRGLEFDDPSGFPVYLGVGSDMIDRVTVWRAIRQDLTERGLTPSYIDVRFPLAPYYGR